ncbi:ubiquitin E3 ligase ICP0 [Chimpanzee herpesvirus strain 105640]|uniref:Ubiquitin E3 ligase ICP0 n=1 Tax=Chimpanzee herpesvirus strain 105640 TaxID=332937 RepID=K9MG59_9ALPH|nr:ubiquitin E3 ligase ICP0 [Chimpanzee herpesvirus strain 105640]YP_009011045.1 ubiquitin E3 ligase ICP0 [Chimpanzee herpesvirus strain 105640]AFV26888.1 ubiquitin E3 ligase ICP0 [Chimpanzee herpesvirus strain 105640]AFV26947.1 ubiquitin E3 ligase ICP0 [Chimpanzee herpesvirus strain 105640]
MEPRPGASSRADPGAERPRRETPDTQPTAPNAWGLLTDLQWLASSDSEVETEVGISDDDLHRDSTSEAGSTDTEMFETGLMDMTTPPARPTAERQGSPPPDDAPRPCGGGPEGEGGAGGEGDVCAVCTDEIPPPLRCQSFPCLHPFCIPCMKTWIQLRNTCPLCNTRLAYLIVGVTPRGSFSTIPIVNDPQTRVEAEAAVRAGTAVDFIWTGNQQTAPRSVTLGGHTVRALSPAPPWPGTDDEDDDLADVDYVPPAPRRAPRRGGGGSGSTRGASQPAAARPAPPGVPRSSNSSSSSAPSRAGMGSGSGSGGGSAAAVVAARAAALPPAAGGGRAPSRRVGGDSEAAQGRAPPPRQPRAAQEPPIVISDSPPPSPRRPAGPGPLPFSSSSAHVSSGPAGSLSEPGPAARPHAAVAPRVRSPPRAAAPTPAPVFASADAAGPGAPPAVSVDARRAPRSRMTQAQTDTQPQSLGRAGATDARGSGGPGAEGGPGVPRGTNTPATTTAAACLVEGAAARSRKRRGSGSGSGPAASSAGSAAASSSAAAPRSPLAPQGVGAKRAAPRRPPDSESGGRGHGLAPASSDAAPPSASPSSQAAVATSSCRSSSSSSSCSSAGGAGGSVASAPGAGERRETSLGPRAAAPRGPRKCARKTRHAEGGPEPGAGPAAGLTRYLPISGVSSVVALAPYVNKTVTGDCLPVLDMETGHIGAYLVLVDQTGNVADRLRDAAPTWGRRTLLPEHARNCVRPPDYPTPPASEWNSLWMTPVGNMLFDQGTLVGALDFHSLRSRHPWSLEQGAPAPAGDAPVGHRE